MIESPTSSYISVLVMVILATTGINSQTITTNGISDTRLLAGYTAKMIPKGQGEIHSMDLLLHSVDYGISDHFNLGGGIFYLPTRTSVLLIKGKVGVDINDNFSLALSNYTIIPLSSEENYSFINPLIALASMRVKKILITGGFGAIFSDDDINLTAQLGAIIPISEKFALISENYWGYDPTDNTYNDNIFFIAFGGRYMVNKWILELGIVNGIIIGGDGNGIAPFPHFGVAYKIW